MFSRLDCEGEASFIASFSFMPVYLPPDGGQKNVRNIIENKNKRVYIVQVLS
jgi:hypothetical protein